MVEAIRRVSQLLYGWWNWKGISKVRRSNWGLLRIIKVETPRASPWHLKPSFAWPKSWVFCHRTYFNMLFSSRPIVETKYPGDQTMFSFQYTLDNQENFFLNLLAVWAFILLITSDTLYLGGIIITIWIWSVWILYSIISQPGRLLIILGKSFLKYPRRPGFRIRRRYLDTHTIWYSVRYALCPESLISISTL